METFRCHGNFRDSPEKFPMCTQNMGFHDTGGGEGTWCWLVGAGPPDRLRAGGGCAGSRIEATCPTCKFVGAVTCLPAASLQCSRIRIPACSPSLVCAGGNVPGRYQGRGRGRGTRVQYGGWRRTPPLGPWGCSSSPALHNDGLFLDAGATIQRPSSHHRATWPLHSRRNT